ncbi:hypothetical protein PVK06_030118 [Gossypium arboreum]|uniref:RNase H type-1 domain-containing protein n=1 Tax=Gossypium arboreum TaxID=29729 RepID=A0ABR0NME8_GOSAR|nr:hypothetical protein PVK06_030118 [Gossypium arboreum]
MRLKINFDAAFNKHKKESCSGLVIRNNKAQIIVSKTVMNSNIPSAFAAEAVACLQGLQLGLHLGLREVEVEGDSRTVICKLQVEQEDRSEISVFINDSKKLSLGFQTCVFLFTNRDVNKVAHLIASEGIRRRESTYMVNQVLSVAAEIVAEDQKRTQSMRELRSRRVGDEEKKCFFESICGRSFRKEGVINEVCWFLKCFWMLE